MMRAPARSDPVSGRSVLRIRLPPERGPEGAAATAERPPRTEVDGGIPL